ncbi:hypothetical protein PAXRUDRAFT_802378 [Paxillus rubicundulus Ve08.2h10]|uniref:BRCT domain-containing protein n=1 Tax=Paxillus rubicundulus Ve08.2h10 TaxID=930991 RepID=A0A0D0DYM0_9AGAM|nr:hypothetical protein PAXRUDRAFT_802378 [Paxillus rubicundulus Ve08.2h10]
MAVFDGVHYILSPSVPLTRRHELSSILDLNGATNAPPHTHFVALAGSHSLNDKLSAGPLNATLKIVSDRWVDRSVVMGKIQPEQYYSPEPAMIFSGIVACATDLPASDLEVLSAGITALGGQWRIGLTRDVTHLFAIRPGTDKVYNTALHFAPQTHMSILTPHWFDDSVRLGRRLPEVPYAWPDPPVLRPGAMLTIEDDQGVTDSKRKRKKVADAEVLGEEGASVSIEGEKDRVWGGRRILLSHSLELGKGSREAVEAGIRRTGGVLVKIHTTGDEQDAEEKAVDECDVLITRWRSGKAYFKAVRASLLIGTLTWLFGVESSGTLHSPLDSLLWYPVPRGGVPGLVDREISLTNYTGAARDYLKRLILLMGGKFTPSMSARNMVLVAGFQPSPKTTRALAWSIPIVNHTWLEDCFVEWRALTVGLERYIVFPPSIDFGKMLITGNNESFTNATTPMLSGGALPGGRGVGTIDVDFEEARDDTYAEELEAYENGAVDLGNDDVAAKGVNKKKPHPADENSSRSAKPTLPTRSQVGSASDMVVDTVIEIPDDKEGELGEGLVKRRGGTHSGYVRPSVSKPKTTASTAKSRGVSKPTPLRDPSPGTSANARDVREIAEVVTIDPCDENGFLPAARNDVVMGDGDGDNVHPVDTDGDLEERQPRPALEALKSKSDAKCKKSGSVDNDMSAEEDVRTGVVKGRLTRAKSPLREPRSPAQPIKHPSPYRPKPNLVRRSLASSAALRLEAESEPELQMGDAEAATSKTDQRAPSMSKLGSSRKARLRGQASAAESDSDSELSAPPPRRPPSMTMTPIKSGMKPKPKLTAKRTEDDQDESDEDVYVRPVRGKGSGKAKAKDKSKDKATTSKLKAKDATTEKHMPRSLARSPSPAPPTKSIRTPKRTLTVIIPPVPKDYFSPSGDKGAESSANGTRAKPMEITRMSSIRAAAAEASTSGTKRTKPPPTDLFTPSPGRAPKHSAAKSKPGRVAAEFELENEISMVVDSPLTMSTSRGGSKRNAANKASTKLREEIIPDVISFEKQRKNEKRRRSKGGESAISPEDADEQRERERKKRKIEKDKPRGNGKGKAKKPVSDDEEDEEEAEVVNVISIPKEKPKPVKGVEGKPKAPAAKGFDEGVDEGFVKSKVKGRPEQKEVSRTKSEGPSRTRHSDATAVRLMTTGVILSDDIIKRLTKLGIQMTTKPTDCTHLIAKGVVRTEKFLCAMSVTPHVLTEEWANATAKTSKLLPEDEYLLSDPVAEKKWNFKFSDSIERSKGPDGGSNLFKQMTFYVTPKVSVDIKLLKNVVSAGGGQVQTAKPTLRILKGGKNRYVVSCPEDISIWRPLAQEGYKIYSTELILQSVLKQDIDWQNKACIVTE